ncbi:MAG: glycosyltransferase family 2 protein [Eubacterium sp.]|nr:glycosyltransferase family 2 protein [Eubacterium sp.]
MKLLTITVPCYNSAAYMRNCIDSLLPGGDLVEILIVDDGSTKDDTPAIADELEAAHPGIVRAIHQENRGHGGAVMTGIRNATGIYFKVVDSDDWVDPEAYKKVLETLQAFAEGDRNVDMMVSNYVYEKQGARHKKVVEYRRSIPAGQIIGWDRVGKFPVGHYLLMHALIYRTELLRESGLDLPLHTFYVDNLYAYVPMRCVRKLYYLDVDFYRYFIGREDQSVNEKIMISRIDQQLLVNRRMMTDVDLEHVEEPRLRAYLLNYFEIITAISSILCIRSGTEENRRKKDALWADIKEQDPWAYRRIKHRIMGWGVTKNSKFMNGFCTLVYKAGQRIFGFN